MPQDRASQSTPDGKSPWISDLHWVRPGKQTRSQKTQEKLLDAAEALFAEHGVEATSVADVAKQAGCSVGAVYHHFSDKQALMYAVFDRSTETVRETTRQAADPARWEGATIQDILREFLTFTMETGRDRPAFKRARYAIAREDPELQRQQTEHQAEVDDGLSDLILTRRDAIGHPEPELAVGFVIDQLGSMLKTRLDELLRQSRLGNESDEVFIREAVRSACAYLQLDD